MPWMKKKRERQDREGEVNEPDRMRRRDGAMTGWMDDDTRQESEREVDVPAHTGEVNGEP